MFALRRLALCVFLLALVSVAWSSARAQTKPLTIQSLNGMSSRARQATALSVCGRRRGPARSPFGSSPARILTRAVASAICPPCVRRAAAVIARLKTRVVLIDSPGPPGAVCAVCASCPEIPRPALLWGPHSAEDRIDPHQGSPQKKPLPFTRPHFSAPRARARRVAAEPRDSEFSRSQVALRPGCSSRTRGRPRTDRRRQAPSHPTYSRHHR